MCAEQKTFEGMPCINITKHLDSIRFHEMEHVRYDKIISITIDGVDKILGAIETFGESVNTVWSSIDKRLKYEAYGYAIDNPDVGDKRWYLYVTVDISPDAIDGEGNCSIQYTIMTTDEDQANNLADIVTKLIIKHQVITEEPIEKKDPEIILWNIVSRNIRNGGADARRKRIKCPPWDEICSNYVAADAINKLVESKGNIDDGKLVFWNGLPGTGKTYAIRALSRAWVDIARFYYIVDPEVLFNDPTYLTDILLEGEYNDKLLVLVLEDSLNFIARENKKEFGSVMSRMLNVAEGILGQGVDVLLILTSNEESRNIDDAFLRPGRCKQALTFKAFSKEEGNTWLKAKAEDKKLSCEKDRPVLADLYAMLNN